MIKITIDGIEKEYTRAQVLGLANALRFADASLQPRMKSIAVLQFVNQILSAYQQTMENDVSEKE